MAGGAVSPRATGGVEQLHCRRQTTHGKEVPMKAVPTISGTQIAMVARQERIPVLVAQALAAKVTLEEALRAESRRRDRFPGLERRRNQVRLLSHLLKPIRRAREQIAKAQGAHARSSARLEELRGQIGPAEHRDREALGRALVDGKAEPASEAAKLKQELEREERRLEALADAVQAADGQIAKAVDANRGDWRRQAMQELSRSR
jgi:hypothetical protein